jgi:hypothetical protein
MVEPGRPHMTILQRITCCISTATRAQAVRAPIHTHTDAHARTHNHTNRSTHVHTHTHKYVTFIDFPQQQWFREHASVLCYTYIASIFSNIKASNWT